MRIYQSHNKSNGISFAVNPSTLLSQTYRPLKLFRPTKSNVQRLKGQFKEIFEEIKLSHHGTPIITPEDLSLSRIDLTVDLYFSKDTNLSSLIHIFRKSKCLRHHKRHELEGETAHYFSIETKKSCFKIYDKIYELKKFHRCPPEMKGQNVLRLEVTMKREKFLKHFNLKRKDDLYVMLNTAHQQIRDVFCHYLNQLFPASGTHLPYAEAIRKIKWSAFDSKTKEQMLFLVEKTSRSAGLDTAAHKWKKAYNIVGNHAFDQLTKMFDQIDVNPVTLRVKEKHNIPCLRKMILSEIGYIQSIKYLKQYTFE